MNATKQIPEQLILISVDSYENKTASGRFWYGNQSQETSFDNLMQLILAIDTVLEDLNYPEEDCKCKSFVRPDNKKNVALQVPKEAIEPTSGALATFQLKILFRQNTSWQGILMWAESRQEKTFRSVLELIKLLDSALTHAEGLSAEQLG